MPGKVKVKILSGRNLPVMDRSSDTTDAYVEIKLGNTTYKTDVCRKSLNPQWNSEWYRFEVDDSELQDEPLQIRLMDHDTYSANDAIGKVYLDLNPLLLPNVPAPIASGGGSIMSGWIPVYDTMHGIRGEVNIIVKVELFSDFNKFPPVIPQGYHAQVIHGFVEELVVNDDPEYQWIDKIRTPRASNEARQTLFFKLSGEIQRKIGLKALDLGGNAVIGYSQNFDLEGESGIVARGIGTAVTLTKIQDNSIPLDTNFQNDKSATALYCYPSHEYESTLSSVLIAPDYKEHGPCLIPSSRNDSDAAANRIPGSGTPNASNQVNSQHPPVGAKSSHSPAKVNSVPCIHRRSSDSDLSITPKGNSLTGSDRSYGPKDSHCRQNSLLIRPSMNQENLDMLEYPFLTMLKYPPGFIQHLGGTVSARSVKLLERITNLEEPETRDAWWTELRMEVRSHARAMGCNVVVGYSENTSICDDVCVLSASGTAALINLNASVSDSDLQNQSKEIMTASLDRCDFEKESKTNNKQIVDKSGDSAMVGTGVNIVSKPRNPPDGSLDVDVVACTVCHIPYSETSVPFRVNMQKCAVCGRGKVPDVLFTTIDLIDNVPTIGKGSFIHAYVCRPKRDCKGEMNAKEISDGLPFLEYELHRLLINKLKVKGMNTIFGLKVQVSIGEKILIGLATGTAVFLSALPAPPVPKISAGNSWKDSKKLAEMQKQLLETVKKSKDFYQIKICPDSDGHLNGRRLSEDTDESEDEYADLDLSLGNKDTCILEVDDAEDADVVSLLIDPMPPEGFHVVSTETVHGLEEFEIVKNLQMFTQVWRAKIPLGQPLSAFNQHFNRLLQSVYFKLRHMVPCALSDLQFKVILEQDEIQLSLLGMALGLGENELKKKKLKSKLLPSLSRETVKKSDDSDLIFTLEEDSIGQVKSRNRSPVRGGKSLLKHVRVPLLKKKFFIWKIHLLANDENIFFFFYFQKTPPRSRYGVDITPLPYVPGGKIEKYLGNLNFFFIRESTCIREGGGLGGFIHSFITEVLAIVRAHVTALGGNAMVAYFMSECFLYHYPHKNQGQCLINVGGDVVYISYFSEE
ncbi:conserved hypothetical protein [Pediculus humanus corporis]|uniref:C2 domain-containing protein n=1 Tax=Pediculus humanus subsp. corporis TaxID=121224 RepID=E0VNP6_PEDHC|nr:uncharacterized protein Phum_PHUM338980 [Pediculus humanus corporis]EEB15002.1 conserved hypothetical protein [Pediculus humanus corporis]